MNHPAVTDYSMTALTLSVRQDKLRSLTFKLCTPGTATVLSATERSSVWSAH